jgi:hypothetical protein
LRDNSAVTIMLPPRPRILILFVAAFSSRSPPYTGHRILQERDRRPCREAMLAAQMQKSADKAMAAVAVIITAAGPVPVVREKLEHQIE